MFNGHNCVEVCSVGSGISSAASCYYCKGHFCDQFLTKFDDTEYVYQYKIGTRGKPGIQLVIHDWIPSMVDWTTVMFNSISPLQRLYLDSYGIYSFRHKYQLF